MALEAGVPGPLQGMIRGRFRDKYRRPILLDWEGRLIKALPPRKSVVNLFLVDRVGAVFANETGPPTAESKDRVFRALDRALATAAP